MRLANSWPYSASRSELMHFRRSQVRVSADFAESGSTGTKGGAMGVPGEEEEEGEEEEKDKKKEGERIKKEER